MNTALFLIVVLIVAGLFIWAVQTFLTMIPVMFRNLICFIIVIGAAFTIWDKFGG